MLARDGLRPHEADHVPEHADFAKTAQKVPGEETKRFALNKQKKPGKIDFP
jgi:hypothetical protein